MDYEFIWIDYKIKFTSLIGQLKLINTWLRNVLGIKSKVFMIILDHNFCFSYSKVMLFKYFTKIFLLLGSRWSSIFLISPFCSVLHASRILASYKEEIFNKFVVFYPTEPRILSCSKLNLQHLTKYLSPSAV